MVLWVMIGQRLQKPEVASNEVSGMEEVSLRGARVVDVLRQLPACKLRKDSNESSGTVLRTVVFS